GGPAGSDPELMRQQLLEEYGVEAVILTGSFYNVAFLPNPDLAAALARALNDWTVERWLEFDPRFRGSLALPLQDPAAAGAEDERLGGDPRIVQVGVAAVSRIPYGQPYYQ